MIQHPNSFRYWSHACQIESDISFPELSHSLVADAAQIRIKRRPGSPPPSQYGFARREAGFRLWWNDIASLDIDHDGDLWVEALGQDEDLLRLAVLGGGLAVALQFQNRFVFHGNSIAVCNSGAVIVGPKGAGKSTLTAAFIARGHRLLSDDLATVGLDRVGEPQVYRGNLQLKLWPDSVQGCFGKKPEEFPHVFGEESKRRIPSQDFASVADSLPLRRVYVLHEAPEISGHSLRPPEAWREAMGHSYASRFGAELLQGEWAARHFAQCAQLVREVPFVRLDRPKDFSKITDVVRWIEDDLAHA